MPKLRFILLLIITPFLNIGFSQESFFDIMNNILVINNIEQNKNNHIALKYRHFSDQDASKSIEWKGDTINMTLLYVDTVTWKEQIKYSKSSLLVDWGNYQKSESVVTFNEMGNIVKLTKKSTELDQLLEEEINYKYNDFNNIISISLKTNMNEPSNLIQFFYNNDQVIPDSIKLQSGFELFIDKTTHKDTFIINYKTQLAESVIKEHRELLGEDATEEDIIKSIGIYKKMPEKYSKIYLLPNNTIYEIFYMSYDDEVPQAKGYYNYTKDFKPLSKKWFSYGQENNISYDYFDDGRIKSITVDTIKNNFEYLSDNKLIKAYEDPYTIYYVYSNNRIIGEYKILIDELTEYLEYIYYD